MYLYENQYCLFVLILCVTKYNIFSSLVLLRRCSVDTVPLISEI